MRADRGPAGIGVALVLAFLCALAGPSWAAAANTRAIGAVDARAAELGSSVKLPAAKADPGPDIERLRTRTSQTFEAEGGSYETRISRESINYRDSLGRWQPIDNRLEIDGDHLRNGANRYSVSIPRQLGSEPIRVDYGDAWIEFAPQVASTKAASLRGSEAAFADAWPGVELRYAATADSVKEALVVRDLASIRDFAFDLRVPSGHTPVADRFGAVSVRDPKGVVKLQLSRSTMVDAAGAMANSASELRRGPRGWELVQIPDRTWLSDPSRKWPVTIDPTVTFGGGGSLMCNIWKWGGGLSETGSECGTNTSALVGASDPNAPDTYDYRLLLNYEGVALPPGAVVEFATIDPVTEGSPPYEAFNFYEMTTPWNEYATWETSDGTTQWTGPGAELDHTPTALSTAGLTDLVRRWASGETDNYGLLMTRPDPNDCLCYTGGPQLLIQYAETEDPDSLAQANSVGEYSVTAAISATEAARRLRLQDRFGNLYDDLEDAIDAADFGGTWFDDTDDGRLKIGIKTNDPTPPSGKTADARELLEDHDLLGEADFVSVDFNEGQLDAAEEDVLADLAALQAAGKVRVSIDVEANGLRVQEANTITLTEHGQVTAAAAGVSVPTSIVAVDVADLRPVLAEGCGLTTFRWLACDAPLRGGIAIRHRTYNATADCTTGFLAEGTDSPHIPYVLTAGHCKVDPNFPRWHAFTHDGEDDPLDIGPIADSSFSGGNRDVAIIEIDDESPFDDSDPGLIYVTDNNASNTVHEELFEIRRVAQKRPSKGRRMCITFGPENHAVEQRHTVCGKVEDRYTRAETTDGHITKGAVFVRTCLPAPSPHTETFRNRQQYPQGGSGGPVYRNHTAYGIGIATTDCGFYFYPSGAAEDAMEVEIKTAD